MTIDVKELRGAERYVPADSLAGTYGGSEVTIVNVGFGGAQITHSLPLRIGSSARLWFRVGDVAVQASARLIWSHLSKIEGSTKTCYRSGIRVEDPSFAEAIDTLVRRGIVSVDDGTLERKRRRLIEKERERSGKTIVKIVPAEATISPEHLLLIEHARERLRANPHEAERLYAQARTADAANGVRQDAVAVWEYLERSIGLQTIMRVFDQSR